MSSNARLLAKLSGRVLTPALPVWTQAYGAASATSTTTEATRLATGRRITPSAIRDQTAPGLRPNGSRSASTRSPSSASNAGTSVSAAPTETSTTVIAPTARLRKIVCGTTNMPISAITTVSPLKSTARLEVAPARAIASSVSRPALRSSRKRETTNSE
jgi:hypothetical protein